MIVRHNILVATVTARICTCTSNTPIGHLYTESGLKFSDQLSMVQSTNNPSHIQTHLIHCWQLSNCSITVLSHHTHISSQLILDVSTNSKIWLILWPINSLHQVLKPYLLEYGCIWTLLKIIIVSVYYIYHLFMNSILNLPSLCKMW